jgi:hypothetical protein
MNLKVVVIVAVLAVLGVYFFGIGITGMVVSESCCFGQNCNPENLCESARPALQEPTSLDQSVNTVYLGWSLILVAGILYVMFHRKK